MHTIGKKKINLEVLNWKVLIRNYFQFQVEIQIDYLYFISDLYLYLNTPPVGYGTQAPKVAENIIRSYEYNLKIQNREMVIDSRTMSRLHWEAEDAEFPFDEIHHGNFSRDGLCTHACEVT